MLLALIVQSVLPVEIKMPLVALPAPKKLKMLLLEIVLPLLFVAVVVVEPLEKIPLSGVVAPSRMSQLSIVLLSLPFAPVVVLNRTTPPVVEVLTPDNVA